MRNIFVLLENARCSERFYLKINGFFGRKLQDTFGAPNVVGSKKILRGFS
jgi:hypothetical protein